MLDRDWLDGLIGKIVFETPLNEKTFHAKLWMTYGAEKLRDAILAAPPQPTMEGHKWDEGWNRMTQTNRCEVSGLLNRECYGCLRGEIDRLNDELQYALDMKEGG